MSSPCFIKSLKLSNFLSFGEDSPAIPLQSLNIIIGPNGSGKSNFLEAIDLLRSAPNELYKPIREGGGVRDWLWKGGNTQTPVASIDAVIEAPTNVPQPLRYRFSFTAAGYRFELVDETIEHESVHGKSKEPYFYYKFNHGKPVLNVKESQSRATQRAGRNGHKPFLRHLRMEEINIESSVLREIRDAEQYPEITYVGKAFEKMRLYREWSFGRGSPLRLPQRADLPNNLLEVDGGNLGLILNRLDGEPAIRRKLTEALQALYAGIEGYHVLTEGGTTQIFLHEGNKKIPATRLSDGTLRYLCLLVILLHPNPPPVVCIEEPELGLHPDLMPTIVALLKDAATRCQLIVTTHSDGLVDAMTDQPESILVCEQDDKLGTTLKRLDAEALNPWLVADREALQSYFGKNFNKKALPAISRRVEAIPKQELEDSLNRAAINTAKKGYNKGRDSFALLEKTNPAVVRQGSPWADRFLAELEGKCQ
ncbi:AAA family ATPase [Thiothrix nivea]|uniref:SMC domain protein n=1 Tax=Thiothrix nivea (strain ATCC 35100 / DSM 5205 / JP2) TaxID=870187 RepID=A0A656HA69_THINJ|nr:DUF4276 family protein [Thiothrix nivea]EIJ33598.1 SMC domain protein [Thiothrix nivea DSM 5205]